MTASTSYAGAAPDPDTLREEAGIWLNRLVLGDVTQAEMRAFRRWQGASDAHAAAFEAARRQWHAMKPVAGELLRTDARAAARHERLKDGPRRRGRRAFLGAAAGAMATAAGVAVFHPPLGLWPAPGLWGADYRTATGEQRAVALAERVNVVLNTDTRIRRAGRDGTPGIALLDGEAAIDLTGPGDPFGVQAGAGRAWAQTGHFQVRYLDGQACVSCLDGEVRVEHPLGARTLRARQQLVYDDQSLSGVAGIEPEDVSAWRRGELVFHRTPLAQVVDEINRYRPGRVVLMNDAKRQTPVSGRFRTAVLDEAILQLQHTFGLHARELPAGVLLLS
ncbi:transmembrane sensor [Bordetella ansorpii]|uniref:Transmembrane sensor n=1 Tax=Bordetella ansorpii TaxID=288768 RepID=A0A157SWX9_9BORD|nr:FecR domain-containing protein [Bordetella ansorpii]SAI74795.1 transmembrane sensor [Bordetella ansorpii]